MTESITILTPEAIMLAAPKPKTVTEPVPEWGGAVKVRGFTRDEIKTLRKACTVTTEMGGKTKEQLDDDKFERELFLAGLVEPKLTADHWTELQNRTAGGIETILKAITRESGLTKEEAAKLKAAFPSEDGSLVGALPDQGAEARDGGEPQG
jgi:hypothetical protein